MKTKVYRIVLCLVPFNISKRTLGKTKDHSLTEILKAVSKEFIKLEHKMSVIPHRESLRYPGRDNLQASMLSATTCSLYLLRVDIIKANPTTSCTFFLFRHTCRAGCGCASKAETSGRSTTPAGPRAKDEGADSCPGAARDHWFALLTEEQRLRRTGFSRAAEGRAAPKTAGLAKHKGSHRGTGGWGGAAK